MSTETIIDLATGTVSTVTREPTLAERKAAMKQAIDATRDALFSAGFTVAGTGTSLDGKVLQTRDVVDRTNWLTSQASYSTAVAGGFGDVVGATFRTADNVTVILTYAQGLNVLLAMAGWGAAVMGNSWALKDAVDAAEDEEALDAIDIGAGWP